jgi:Phosphotransferase enzyme family
MAERGARPLPVAIEEIDCDWLTAALRTGAPAVTVRDCEIVDIARGTCTKIRLKLDLDEAGRRAGIPSTVILKGGFEPHSRDWHFMHEKEVHAYRDVLPVLKLPSPACYFADYDAQRRQGIVIMDDLAARGVTFCNPLKPQTHEDVARRLTVLARHHAKTWGSPDFAPGGRWSWAQDVAATTRAYFSPYLVPDIWRRFVDSPRGAASSVRFHDRDLMEDALKRHVILSARLPPCLVHGDTHLGNLYVEPDGTPGFFDSLPDRAPGMLEVAYHIPCALDLADRRRWEGALVRHYLDELARNGAAPPGFDEAMRQYSAFLARGYIMFLVNESHFQAEAINTAYTARFSAAMLDHDTIGLLRTIA